MNITKLKIKAKELLIKFAAIDDTPHKIAGGAALGVWLGIFPGLGVIATIVVAAFLKLNKLSAITGAILTNTWLSVLALPPAIALGAWIFNEDSTVLKTAFQQAWQGRQWWQLISLSWSDLLLPVFVGLTLIGSVAGLLSYGLILKLLEIHHRRLDRKKQRSAD